MISCLMCEFRPFMAAGCLCCVCCIVFSASDLASLPAVSLCLFWLGILEIAPTHKVITMPCYFNCIGVEKTIPLAFYQSSKFNYCHEPYAFSLELQSPEMRIQTKRYKMKKKHNLDHNQIFLQTFSTMFLKNRSQTGKISHEFPGWSLIYRNYL